ncbi:MAG: glycoside hydrolase family 99-like domain-containing protein [Candidatus Euphemobacter frigidus]|nr:glycoside hydrolase family 99-like domain-containing protein [Candidatus Euphemobacter frigidus]MDP8275716.1 glycoside hydrolase family 99-like domain-containing protein [Candidatus Euphemobacter frigidus]
MITSLRHLSFLSLATSLTMLVLFSVGCGPPPPKQPLVGAYYYLWFPRNFRKMGYLRGYLKPPQSPVLGSYNSSDPEAAERHIAWCSRYGIDFLAIDWWPNFPQRNKSLDDGFLQAPNIQDIKWCIFYETQSLGVNRAGGTINWNEKKTARLVADLLKFAATYFNHPSYLKIDGRPVIFLYVTRTFRGDTAAVLKKVRVELGKQGIDPFIIGDEVFWEVTVDGGGEDSFVEWTDTPQRSRIKLFDAVTPYNMYETRKRGHAGYGAESRYLSEVDEKFAEYREACGDDVVFIPNVIPGYNDRPLRLRRDHYVIPRLWKKDGAPGSLFSVLFDRLGLKYADPDLPIIMITSWNEWNEDTAIEPLTPAPPTTRDISKSGTRFTEGYPYSGFGETYLRIIRDKVVAVSGRVMDEKGNPVPGVAVEGRSEGRVVASDRTDAVGYYRLPRMARGEGEYRVGLKGRNSRRLVTLHKNRATIGINFILR